MSNMFKLLIVTSCVMYVQLLYITLFLEFSFGLVLSLCFASKVLSQIFLFVCFSKDPVYSMQTCLLFLQGLSDIVVVGSIRPPL